MTTPTLPDVDLEQMVDDDDSLDHWFCCDPDRALCGRDVSADREVDPNDEISSDDCVVCVELLGQPSPCCGLVVEP